MSEQMVYTCDRCGQVKGDRSVVGKVQLLRGFIPDPAGGSGEPDYFTADFCLSCLVRGLKKFGEKAPVWMSQGLWEYLQGRNFIFRDPRQEGERK